MFVYILSNFSGTLYIGVTNDICRRLQEHKEKLHPNSFTARYNINRLLYYEEVKYPNEAIEREKQIKRWNREKKLNLIQEVNPCLEDISEELFDENENDYP